MWGINPTATTGRGWPPACPLPTCTIGFGTFFPRVDEKRQPSASEWNRDAVLRILQNVETPGRGPIPDPGRGGWNPRGTAKRQLFPTTPSSTSSRPPLLIREGSSNPPVPKVLSSYEKNYTQPFPRLHSKPEDFFLTPRRKRPIWLEQGKSLHRRTSPLPAAGAVPLSGGGIVTICGQELSLAGTEIAGRVLP